MKLAHCWISGRVQGVFYRANTRDQARKRDLTGWVKNLRDGRVEAVFEGEERKVKSMIEWCKKGSPPASVENVEVEWEEPHGLDSFQIKY